MAKRVQLDDDPDSGTERCAVGPGRRKRSSGAIIQAYVDYDAIDRTCDTCGAQPLQFCRNLITRQELPTPHPGR